MSNYTINNAGEILQKKITSNELAIQILNLDKLKYDARRAADAHSKYLCDEKIKLVAELTAEYSSQMKSMTDWREEYCQNLIKQINDLDELDETQELYNNIHKYDATINMLMAQRDNIESSIPTTADISQYKFKCSNNCATD